MNYNGDYQMLDKGIHPVYLFRIPSCTSLKYRKKEFPNMISPKSLRN